MTTPAEDLTLLRERIREVFAWRGLDTWQVAFVPDGTGVVVVHIIAGLADETTSTDDDGFDEVIASAERAELEQRTQRSAEELGRRLMRRGGFLDDD